MTMSWNDEQLIRVVLEPESRQPLADALELAQRLRVRLLAQLEVFDEGDGAPVAFGGAGALAEGGLCVAQRAKLDGDFGAGAGVDRVLSGERFTHGQGGTELLSRGLGAAGLGQGDADAMNGIGEHEGSPGILGIGVVQGLVDRPGGLAVGEGLGEPALLEPDARTGAQRRGACEPDRGMARESRHTGLTGRERLFIKLETGGGVTVADFH